MRQPTGVRFFAKAAASRHPERIALLARHLSWLTPLSALGTDDQRVLGLVNAAGRPVHAGDLEDGGGESEGAAEPEPDEPAPLGRLEHAAA